MTGWNCESGEKACSGHAKKRPENLRDAENMARLGKCGTGGRHRRRTTQALSVRDLLPHMQGMRRQISSGDWKMNWGKRQRMCDVIHSLAECQATAHQETAFSVFTGKSGCLLNPFRRPAHIPSRQAISRATSSAPF